VGLTDLSECRILIVDDVKANAGMLVQALRGGPKLSLALDGESALRKIAGQGRSSERHPDEEARTMTMKSWNWIVLVTTIAAVSGGTVLAEEDQAAELAKKVANPVAALISVPSTTTTRISGWVTRDPSAR